MPSEMEDCVIIIAFAQCEKHRHIGWRKRGTGIEGHKEVINKSGLPVLIPHLHLGEQESPRIVALAALACVRASTVEAPIPRRKDQNVTTPNSDCGCE